MDNLFFKVIQPSVIMYKAASHFAILDSVPTSQVITYQVIVLWMSLPETIKKQKDSMGIIGNDMRI